MIEAVIEQGRERRWTAADGTALNGSGCGGRADGAERQRIRGTTIEAVIEQVGVGRWNRWNRWHWSAAFQSRRLFSRQRIGGFSVAAASQSLGFSVDGGIGGFSVDGGWQLHG